MQLSPQHHMRRPLLVFIASAIGIAVIVTLAVMLIGRFRPSDGSLDVWLSWLPGAGLTLWFFILFRYLKHYDEMLRDILLKSLAVSAVAGFVLIFTRIVQLDIGLPSTIQDAFIISIMALAFVACALSLRWRYR